MKMKITARIYTILLAFVLMFVPYMVTSMQAQTTLKGKLVVKDKNGKVSVHDGENIPIFYFYTSDACNDFMKQCKTLNDAQKGGWSYFTTDPEGEGAFTANGIPDNSYVAVFLPSTGDMPKSYHVTASNRNNLIITMIDEYIALEEVVKTEKKKEKPSIKPGKTRMYGDKMSFKVSFPFPADYCSTDKRLMVLPAAIDCSTEDTVKYLNPAVIEGKKFHKMQNRRMSFDYETLDPLAVYFQESPVIEDNKDLVFEVFIPFTKPNINKSYTCWGSAVMEDFTHVSYRLDGEFGSCNVSNPFKFLEFQMSGTEIPLTEEFYERPSAGLVNIPRDLPLKFKVGTAEYTQDESNQKLLNQLVKELSSYGEKMVSIEISGAASPDGNVDVNMRLAKSRAEKALSEVRSRINTRKIQIPPPSAFVFTWKDVADSLDQRGYEWEAKDVRGMVESKASSSAIHAETKTFDIYDTVIVEILNNMRVMKCSYTYQQTRILEPAEAVDFYYNNPDYAPGGPHVFTNGDYYNILSYVKDSVEQKKIVQRIWGELTARSGYQYNTFAAYIANRMAMYAVEDESIDSLIAMPFLDWSATTDLKRQISINNTMKWTVNRRQIVANQAIILLKRGHMDHASLWIDKLPDDMPVKKELQMYRRMIDVIIRWDDANLEPDEKESGLEAIYSVMSQSKINNAVLKAELQEELGIKMEEAVSTLEALPDDNAKKWYLLGMLCAPTAGTSTDRLVGEALGANYIPKYLAYMQKSFDIQPKYKKFLAQEGNVPKAVSQKYPYVPSKAAAYRDKYAKMVEAKKEATEKASTPAVESSESTTTPQTENKETENKETEQ